MEFVLTETDQSTLIKWDKEKNLLKTFSPEHYRIISEKEFQHLKEIERTAGETVGALAINMTTKPGMDELDRPKGYSF